MSGWWSWTVGSCRGGGQASGAGCAVAASSSKKGLASMAGRFASDDRGSRDGRGRTGAARAPLSRWLAVPVGLRGADGRGAWSELRVVGKRRGHGCRRGGRRRLLGRDFEPPFHAWCSRRGAAALGAGVGCAGGAAFALGDGLRGSACATGDRAPASAAWAWAWPSSGSFAAFLRLHSGPSSQETVKKPSPWQPRAYGN